jgi:hypothetical protein
MVATRDYSHTVDRRTFVGRSALALLGCALPAAADAPRETLYNGITLASPWPPRNRYLSRDPVLPPYLADPPAVIPIDVGRQLFVDDFLIETTTLERTYHTPVYHPANPILRPTTPWERFNSYADRTKTRPNPSSMVFSDGVFYDPADRIFKMWYLGGYGDNTCYATSDDGIAWRKPNLDVVPGTNIVSKEFRDSSTVWLDLDARDRSQRYKMAFWNEHAMSLAVSADGIHWRSAGRSGLAGDRSTFFYNPFRQVWAFSIRDAGPFGAMRVRRYWEHPDFIEAARWREEAPLFWTSADSRDFSRPGINREPQLYNLDCVAYESLLIGLFTIWRGEWEYREKANEVCVGFSRDGFHWSRPVRTAFLPISDRVGDWNWANVQSAGGCCLVVGDQLYFYVSGRRGVPGTQEPGVCTTGLATLRRDGFASMGMPARSIRRVEQHGQPSFTLTTRPLTFTGRYLFVNADTAAGDVRVEVLDREGRVIEPFTRDRCAPIGADSVRARIRWTGSDDLAAAAGRPVRFRFTLTGGRLYAFWVSPSTSGASHGFVAAGGPAYSRPADTTGTSVRA